MLNFIEKHFGLTTELSVVAYYSDFVVIPLILLMMIVTADIGIVAFGGGVIAWSLIEYVVHRFLFHRLPLAKTAHDVHHDHPSGRTGLSSGYTIALYSGLALVAPGGLLAGILAGYLAYIGVHHAFHHWAISPGSWVYSAKMRHVMHHRGIEANFGVTSPVWDMVLRTYAPWPASRTV
jgi:sterol desaturase/sphingolipid hydroxylase (fatty acid hydroxylase superfamily)